MIETKDNQTYKAIGILLATLALLLLGFQYLFAGTKHVELDEQLTWADYSSLLANLFLIALLIERALEIFYVSPIRVPEKRSLTRQLEEAASPKARSDGKDELHHFRSHTRRVCMFAGFGLGILCGLAGIQVLDVVLNADALNGWQESLFRAMDVFLTGAVLGGGSAGVNAISSRLKHFVKPEE